MDRKSFSALLIVFSAPFLLGMPADVFAGDEMIYACAHKASGQLRYVLESGKCRRVEVEISWKQIGPPGTDGVVGAPQQCDVGYVIGFDESGIVICSREADHKIVFVTSTSHRGDFGGVESADRICQSRAYAAGLLGIFRAWVSVSSTNNPATTFMQSNVPYKLLNGDIVAADWHDLTDGELNNPIDRDETGGRWVDDSVWTNTQTDGTYESPDGDCVGWTSTGDGMAGFTGASLNPFDRWTTGTELWCSDAARLYCFEQ